MTCNDQQVRKMMKIKQMYTQLTAALKTGMSAKTARKYAKIGMLPSELKQERDWKTRPNPFQIVWPEIEEKLKQAPELQAKVLLEWLNERGDGPKFQESQLRTLPF